MNYTEARQYAIRYRNGEIPVAEAIATFNDLVERPEAIMAELNALTVPELRKRSNRHFYSNGKKADIVRSMYHDLLSFFHLGGSFSYDPFSEKYVDALKRQVRETTQEQADRYVATRKAEMEKEQAERKQREAMSAKALENPETLYEFGIFIETKGEAALTDEQLERYDTLKADEYLRNMAATKEREATVEAVAVDTDMQLAETVHSKKGIPLYVVKLADRVERDTYQQLNAAAKRLGGWYSSYRGAGAIPGFQFTNRENALSFMALRDGDQQRADTTADKLARVGDRFRDMAERLDDKGDEILTADRKVNTYRRQTMARNIEDRAISMKKQGAMLHALADAMDEGRVKLLIHMRSAADMRDLIKIMNLAFYRRVREENIPSREGKRDFEKEIRYVKYPYPVIYTGHVNSWINDISKVKGSKQVSRWLYDMGVQGQRQGNDYVTLEREYDIMQYRKLTELLEKANGLRSDYMSDEMATYDRMKRMQLPFLPVLRAALREFHAITSNAKSTTDEQAADLEMQRAEREFIGAKYPGFFPTPTDLAQRIVDEADIRPGMRVLEPSAGIGHIADIIRSEHPEAQLDVVEYQYAMRQLLEKKGYNVIGSDIFDLKDAIYDRIVMNPPFEELADIDHVRHAFTLLKPGGRLVAIMADNKQGDRTKVREFRDFVDEHGTMEPNEPGAFKSAFRPTGVNTITVVLDSPEVAVAAPEVQAEPKAATSKFSAGDTVISPVGTVLTLQFESAPGRWYAKLQDGDAGAFFMEADLKPYAAPAPQNLAERLAAQYHLAAAREANGARFQNPSGYAKMMRDDYVKFITDLEAELRPLATSAPQQAALDEGLDQLAQEYLNREKAVLNASSGVVSVFVAGGSKFNHKQAGRRGATLDRVEADFNEWRKKQPQKLRDMVQNARTTEQVAQAEAEADAKAQKMEERRISEAGRAETMKAGDEIVNYVITRVSRDREGYPSSFNAKGKPGTDDPFPDKFDFWRTLKYSSAEQFKSYVDKYRAKQATPDPIAIRARAAATALRLKLKLMQMKY